MVDFTYVPTWSGTAFTAFVSDVYSRRIVGWRTAASMPTELPLHALEMALWTRARAGQDVDGLVHHSDAGAQYTPIRYAARLLDAGAVASIGSVGDSYDCESVLRRSSRCDPCYDWPCGCPGVDLSAGSGDASEVARRAGSDLIGA